MTQVKLTELQEAAISAIKIQESLGSGYHFVGPERRLALRMVEKGLLRPKGAKYPNEYRITAKGNRIFCEDLR